ncbi:MAG TPA: hypothetical protein VMU92_13090 [Acidobacteriaceae bacterium]|nr:hypothetical protein [Acidobacteriaceae bacterium]
MKFRTLSIAPLCLLFAGLSLTPAPAALAQHEAGHVQGPSQYQWLDNIGLKPGQLDAFAKAQSERVQALRAAHAPGYYLGLEAITGSNHVIFLSGFNSFAEAQKDHETIWNNTELAASLKATTATQAPTIRDIHSSVYTYDKDLSLRPDLDISKMRFMRITLFQIRSGHLQDWEHIVKLFAKAYETAIPEAHWAMFEKIYGEGSDSTYILATPMESLSTIDVMHADSKKFDASVGKDQLQMLREQLSKVVKSSETDLFVMGPKISYVPQSWITSSPDFWGKK